MIAPSRTGLCACPNPAAPAGPWCQRCGGYVRPVRLQPVAAPAAAPVMSTPRAVLRVPPASEWPFPGAVTGLHITATRIVWEYDGGES